MFETVLFPTDFSGRADTMLDCVASFPQVKNVILLHVVRETLHPMGASVIDRLTKEKAQATLGAARRYLSSLNPAITVTLESKVAPDVAEGILAAAEETGAGLIVLGAHTRGLRAGILTGSVPSTVLCRISRANVLIMRHRIVDSLSGETFEKFCPMLFTRILCPTDFSKFSDHAAALAGAAAGVREVILLHVVPGGLGKEAIRKAEIKIGRIEKRLAAQGVRCRSLVAAGDPAAEIARVAEEQDASVIWISSFGKGCLHELIAGSTVQAVAMNATRPVLVVRSAR